MKSIAVSLVLGFSLLVGVSPSRAQTFVSVSHSVDSLMEKEMKQFPRGEYLLKHSDSFKRILWLRALSALGMTVDQYCALHAAARQTPSALSGDSVQVEFGNLSNDILDQNETSVAISRKNPSLVVVGANDEGMYTRSMPAYVTTNAGVRWEMFRMPRFTIPSFTPGGDPVLTSDAEGRIYYSFIILDHAHALSNLFLASSLDGKSWKYLNPVLPDSVLMGFEDKESIAVDRDPESPFYGRIYIAWFHYPGDPFDSSGLKLSFSDDHGLTWATPTMLANQGEFVQPTVGHGGLLAISYSGYSLAGTGPIHNILISTDGGHSFTTDSIASFTNYPQNSKGYPGLKGTDGFRSFPYIAASIDEHTNHLHAVYGDYDSVNYVAKQYYSNSTDRGQSWSAPIQIGAMTGNGDCFHPTVALDQTTGKVFASYYSSESDANNVLTKIFRSTLGVSQINPGMPLESTEFNPLECGTWGPTPFIGDYMGSDASGGTYAAAWTQGRPVALDGEVFAYVSTTVPGSSKEVQSKFVINSGVTLSHSSPDPVGDAPSTVTFTLSASASARLELINSAGVVVQRKDWAHLSPGRYSHAFEFSSLPAGAYFFRLTANGEIHSEQIVHIR